jgi:hypothetical protein
VNVETQTPELSVIQNANRSGDFVHQNQVMGTADGFKNVSKLWLDKTITYEKGLEAIEKQRDNREDIVATLDTMTPGVNDDGQLVIQHSDGREFKPTMHAWKQYAIRCDVPHTVLNDLLAAKLKPNGAVKYQRDRADMLLAAEYFMNGIRHHNQLTRGKQYIFRTYKDGTLRSVMTDKYSVVDNLWYMDVLKQLIPGGRLSHWRGDADAIYGNILIPDSIRAEDDSDYGGMLSIGNSEIGTRVIFQTPSTFRAICMNGCIWGQEKGVELRHKHKGLDLDELKGKITENVLKQIPLMHAGLDAFLAKRGKDFAFACNVPALFATVGDFLKFTPEQNVATIGEWLKHEKQHTNLFGIINGITRAGQLDGFSNDEWYRMDIAGGRMMQLDAASWQNMVKRAATMSEDDVKKAFKVKDKSRVDVALSA